MTKAEKTRQFIVEKTAPIFNMKGFAGTSLSDITEGTGLTKGSIYGNFANKDEVAVAVFDYNVSLLRQGLSAITADSVGAVDKLIKMANFYRSEFKRSCTRGGCPILNTSIEADDTHAQLKERAAKSIKAWKKSIVMVVKEGMANKEIKETVDAEKFAAEFIALIEGGILLSKTTGDVGMLNTCINRIETIVNTELKE